LETADVIGKTGRELGMPVEVLERCARERERVFAGVATRGETSFSTPDGIREFEYIANPLRGPNDTVEAIVLSVRDMTERNRVACQIARLKDMYAILSETNQAIMRAQDQDALFREVCRIAVDHGHFELAWIGLVDAETGLIRAAVSSGPAAPSLSTVRVCIDANHPEGRGPMGTAVREGSYRICNDFLGDPNTKPWHEPAVRFGIRSSAAFPLYCQGQVIGAFSLYAGEKDFFDAELTSLLQEMAMDIAYALDNFAREEQRRRAETALLSVKGQLQHLLSVSPAVIYSAKPDGDYRTTFIGEGIHGCLGYSPQELLDTPRFWPDQVHPEDRPRIFAELPHLLETGHHTYEYRFRHQDGTYRWLHDEVRLVRDGAGNPLEIVGCLFDITERRKTEEALRNALAEQRAIFEAALMGIALTQDRRMVRVNRRMLEITGYSREELEGSSTEFLYASRPLFEKVGQEGYPLLAQGKNYDTETQFRRKDGSVIWVRLSGRMIDLSAPVSGSLWVIDDITARKSAEERLLLWAKLLEGSTQAITITDAYNHILMVNRAFTEVTGYTLEEVRGKNPRLLKSGRHDLAFYREMWMALKEIGHWQGEIWNRRKNGEVYPEWLSISTVRNPQGNLTHYIGIFSDITERRAADERIHYLAHYDSLTGLPNRALLNARLEQVIAAAHRCGRHAAVLFLDLDRFKNINDSLGHPIGDLLLQAVGARLKGDLRESDIASRIGGDEFIIVLPDLGAAEDAAVAARHLFDTLSKPFSISGHELSVTASIGISVFPQHGQDVESLIKNADAALYHAKNTGRNNYQFYTEDMNARALEILALENELRRALRREEFVLYYQPQADIHSGQIVGAEALIRWQHPDRGLVGPNTFIPLAEERGLIVPLGNWVLYSACQQNRRWQTEVSRAIPVAVNISALQFRQREFLGKVTDVLRETGLDPCYLELELTESILMHDAEAAIAMVRALKAMGVKLSIDDFGTGYSSLSYLQRFPIDRLKIDGSFVRDMTTHPDAAAITQITISLAKSLNLKVIAEGVKTLEQVELLRAQGCDEVQGYYLSRPLPADEFTQLLKEGRNSSPKTPRSAKNQAESKMG
jgi:diguanylate cyclase (GGDEF)-like protein/PAS domain S-box-containing protein